jgi:hypothetical protein
MYSGRFNQKFIALKKNIFTAVVFIFFLHPAFLSFARQPDSISVEDIKEYILRQHGLEEPEELGTLGLILDMVFATATKDISIVHPKVSKESEASSVDYDTKEPKVLFFLIEENGNLSKLAYDNYLLYPFEIRNILIDMHQTDYTDVKLRFRTFFGDIEKDITLRFNKHSLSPASNSKDFKYWGEYSRDNLQKEFKEIKNKLIEQHYLDSKNNDLGILGELVDSLFTFSRIPEDKDIFIIRRQRIRDVRIHDRYADCFFLSFNASIIVVYNMRFEIEFVYKVRNFQDNISLQSITYVADGAVFVDMLYDTKNLEWKKVKAHRIPYTKTNPEPL